jgi:hypothetical protein
MDIQFHVNKTKVETSSTTMTGLQIKQAAIAAGAKDVELTDLLELVHGQEHTTISDNEPVALHNGEHFDTHPVGKDS